MIRITLLFALIAYLGIYAWRDWYKSLCGLIVLVGIVEHPDMPKTILGIQGLNPWNLLLAMIVPAYLASRRKEKLNWDLPAKFNWLLLIYLTLIMIGFFRMVDREVDILEWNALFEREAPSFGSQLSEFIINCIKWVIPGLLLFDGCRSRERLMWGLFSLLAIYLLLALQVIKHMPLSGLASGAELTHRSLKVLSNEVGYHRVNLSMMLSGAFWAMISCALILKNPKHFKFFLGFAFIIFLGQALTGGRTGYATWAVVGFLMARMRWKKILFIAPVMVVLIVLFVPAVGERFTQGFTQESIDTNTQIESTQETSAEGPHMYTVTAGRNIAWPFVIDKIAERPWIGWGREAMVTAGIATYIYKEMGGEVFPHPHNAYLQWTLDNGVLGAIPVAIFYFLLFRYSVSLFKDSRSKVFISVGGVAFALLAALFVASLGSQTFYPREGAVGMWCAIGLMLRVYLQRVLNEKELAALYKGVKRQVDEEEIDKILWKKKVR